MVRSPHARLMARVTTHAYLQGPVQGIANALVYPLIVSRRSLT